MNYFYKYIIFILGQIEYQGQQVEVILKGMVHLFHTQKKGYGTSPIGVRNYVCN